MPEIIKQSVYMESFNKAMENSEIDVYKESKKLNGTCRDDIDNAIRNCIVPDAHGYKLTDESVKQVIEKHGSERVAVVLANTVMSAEWDGRFSPDTKKWAKNIELPHDSSLKYCECESHRAVLDGYIRLARKELEHKPSVIESLKSTESSLTNSEVKKDMKKSKELEM